MKSFLLGFFCTILISNVSHPHHTAPLWKQTTPRNAELAWTGSCSVSNLEILMNSLNNYSYYGNASESDSAEFNMKISQPSNNVVETAHGSFLKFASTSPAGCSIRPWNVKFLSRRRECKSHVRKMWRILIISISYESALIIFRKTRTETEKKQNANELSRLASQVEDKRTRISTGARENIVEVSLESIQNERRARAIFCFIIFIF